MSSLRILAFQAHWVTEDGHPVAPELSGLVISAHFKLNSRAVSLLKNLFPDRAIDLFIKGGTTRWRLSQRVIFESH